MKLRHFAVFGGIFTVIICLLLFLFIVTADDEENSTSYFDFSGLNLSEEVLKHQPTVEKYAKEILAMGINTVDSFIHLYWF